MPERFAELKQEIAESYPNFEERVTEAWRRLLPALAASTEQIAKEYTHIIPQVNFADLDSLNEETINNIKRRGCVVIRDVVEDAEAAAWKAALQEYVTANPDVPGWFPDGDKQFFMLYWTGPQVKARAHPNVLAATAWLNKFYHLKNQDRLEGVDLSTPLTYADRFRIRHPGVEWQRHPPHVDGGSIERWEDRTFRQCFADILRGDWENHDPYDLEGRLNARSSLYGRPNQASIFRTFQGWLALSETAPTEGTLKVFPDVLLSNAYTILRPFFRPKAGAVSGNPLDAENWEYDISSPEFPGIYPIDGGFTGPRPNPVLHPHLRLDETMVSVPKVYPGDMVFWHCDLIHSVEQEHTGNQDSAVMYIPAVPCTPQNSAYVERQKESFLQGIPPPDFPREKGEAGFKGHGCPEDITTPIGKKAMGLPIEVA
ncbi:DUF1479-domain-containing protein [Gloeophyllum trabeum ATCC 11539]|uniref:DUF1479-domain-containing protein n=1 Tax=Gloeophyllum trabeum (strain ATCC 11539 / FP-39264 / Madison 617) TaxID=670483 RepID=S7RMS7_GLOTA|nr:DUF1479-domain-containing protein [Gloeophyllum trabeum ATCC 11539]EPQ53979.1 DUF1479-domain-containing protein [Gloeophyllum trabeum ATCC 11539]